MFAFSYLKINYMKDRISLQELIALNNTPKAKALVVKHGYSPARNYDDLTYKLMRFTKDFQEEALKELANIHPHKDLILNYNQVELPKKIEKNETSNDDMCQCRLCRQKRLQNQMNYANFEGEVTQTNDKNEKTSNPLKDFAPTILIATMTSFIVVGLLVNVK